LIGRGKLVLFKGSAKRWSFGSLGSHFFPGTSQNPPQAFKVGKPDKALRQALPKNFGGAMTGAKKISPM
jgi:hypothetical protein